MESCRLSDSPRIYAIGNFDGGVTVLKQQKRALNLAWALIEGGELPTRESETPKRIAILGGGFAGLTFAAALLKKQCRCSIALFEERDTLLPLQQGSDTRWLHPHIYDWPKKGSEAVAAMLPLLNWTAARASDVVVQVLGSWSSLVSGLTSATEIDLWCNARHIQLRDDNGANAKLEWVGQHRDAGTGQTYSGNGGFQGRSQDFDMVVLAVGFGLETHKFSYWRNEELAQPGLEQRSSTFLVSGQGDGAIVDLLRLRISQFRQDRILAELFDGRNELISMLRELKQRFENEAAVSLYEAFDSLTKLDGAAGVQMEEARQALAIRLRRDTEVVLKLRKDVRGIADLLGPGKLKASFQNALLLYLLYRCGGFVPASGPLKAIAARYRIAEPYIVTRHGTDRLTPFKRLLPDRLYQQIEGDWEDNNCRKFHQSAETLWPGGYFGSPGRSGDPKQASYDTRTEWRKEYLPGPTALMATSVAGAVAGHILAIRPETQHLRLTLHRAIRIHDEDLLQQSCNYVGRGELDTRPTSARTFPALNATIGQAFVTRKTIRSRPGVKPAELSKAMSRLDLNSASREMSSSVAFVAAVPILQPEEQFFGPSPVCAVLYFDSRDPTFDLSDGDFETLSEIVSRSVEAASLAVANALDRIDNIPLLEIETVPSGAQELRSDVLDELQIVTPEPPRLSHAFTFNFEHSDLAALKN